MPAYGRRGFRIRLILDGVDSYRKKCFFFVNIFREKSVRNVVHRIWNSFYIQICKSPDDLMLYLDGYFIPWSESTLVLQENDIISVRLRPAAAAESPPLEGRVRSEVAPLTAAPETLVESVALVLRRLRDGAGPDDSAALERRRLLQVAEMMEAESATSDASTDEEGVRAIARSLSCRDGVERLCQKMEEQATPPPAPAARHHSITDVSLTEVSRELRRRYEAQRRAQAAERGGCAATAEDAAAAAEDAAAAAEGTAAATKDAAAAAGDERKTGRCPDGRVRSHPKGRVGSGLEIAVKLSPEGQVNSCAGNEAESDPGGEATSGSGNVATSGSRGQIDPGSEAQVRSSVGSRAKPKAVIDDRKPPEAVSGDGAASQPAAGGPALRRVCAVSATGPSCAATVTAPSCAATVKAPSCAATVTAPSCAATVKAPSCAATVTAPSCAATVKAPSCAATVTAPSCAATVTAPSCAATVSAPSCAATVTAPSCSSSGRTPTGAASTVPAARRGDKRPRSSASASSDCSTSDEEEDDSSADEDDASAVKRVARGKPAGESSAPSADATAEASTADTEAPSAEKKKKTRTRRRRGKRRSTPTEPELMPPPPPPLPPPPPVRAPPSDYVRRHGLPRAEIERYKRAGSVALDWNTRPKNRRVVFDDDGNAMAADAAEDHDGGCDDRWRWSRGAERRGGGGGWPRGHRGGSRGRGAERESRPDCGGSGGIDFRLSAIARGASRAGGWDSCDRPADDRRYGADVGAGSVSGVGSDSGAGSGSAADSGSVSGSGPPAPLAHAGLLGGGLVPRALSRPRRCVDPPRRADVLRLEPTGRPARAEDTVQNGATASGTGTDGAGAAARPDTCPGAASGAGAAPGAVCRRAVACDVSSGDSGLVSAGCSPTFAASTPRAGGVVSSSPLADSPAPSRSLASTSSIPTPSPVPSDPNPTASPVPSDPVPAPSPIPSDLIASPSPVLSDPNWERARAGHSPADRSAAPAGWGRVERCRPSPDVGRVGPAAAVARQSQPSGPDVRSLLTQRHRQPIVVTRSSGPPSGRAARPDPPAGPRPVTPAELAAVTRSRPQAATRPNGTEPSAGAEDAAGAGARPATDGSEVGGTPPGDRDVYSNVSVILDHSGGVAVRPVEALSSAGESSDVDDDSGDERDTSGESVASEPASASVDSIANCNVVNAVGQNRRLEKQRARGLASSDDKENCEFAASDTVKDDKYYSQFPVMKEKPQLRDIIAFKCYEMDDNYCPYMSVYTEATVVAVSDQGQLTLQLLDYRPSGRRRGRFELASPDDDEVVDLDEEDGIVEKAWLDLFQPRLMHP